ncbi:hypothetical protein ATT74_26145 [Salmonella enterica subsp. enterica serovar Panama]|nr:hypothetical protein [Salmonella enterica subsp. enterica serovar Panama]
MTQVRTTQIMLNQRRRPAQLRRRWLNITCIHIMRTSATGKRRKWPHRISATAFFTMRPCDDVAFAKNGLKRF